MGTEDNLARQIRSASSRGLIARPDGTDRLRLKLMERLISDVGHDVKNMLTVIIWNLDLVAQAPGHDKTRARVDTALEGALNGVELVRHLMAFGRRHAGKPDNVELGPILRRVDVLANAGITTDVSLELRFDDKLWPVRIDAGAFECGLLELIFAFADLAEDGSKLVLEFANRGEQVLLSAGATGVNKVWQRLASQLAPILGAEALQEEQAVLLALPRARLPVKPQ
jgi:signal transduction histidine kinase